ncbi:MAG: autotransporter-associated beta strand repeat-containing protein [Pirellulales bacterium]|nr:autotransporter-associated beta strand repeat-containing protein [Pirellulales bacterium]
MRLRGFVVAGAVLLLLTGLRGVANAAYVSTLSGMSGLVSNWHLDEMTGNAADAVPGDTLDGDNYGVYSGTGFTQGVAGPQPGDGFYGFSSDNKSVNFSDDVNTKLQMITHSVYADMTAISLVTWVKYPSIPANNNDRRCVGGLQAFASNRYVVASCLYNPGPNGTGLQGFVTQSDGFGANSMDRFDNGINLWHMWVVTYENGYRAKVYLDGEFKDSEDCPNVLGIYAPDGLIFGNDIDTSKNRPWKGEIDEIAMFNRALSSTEISTLWNSALIYKTMTWTGGLGATEPEWSKLGNWAGGEAPTSNCELIYAGSQTVSVNDLPAGTPIIGITFDGTAGAFTLSGDTLDFSGAMKNENANLQTINLELNLVGNVEFNAASGNIAVTQPIGESGGSRSLMKTGAGTLILGAGNTYTGPTTINAGAIRLDHNQALQNSIVTLNVANGVLFNTGITSPVFGGLAGTGDVALQTTTSQAVDLTVGGSNASTTYEGVLSGPAGSSLTKTGSGILSLTNIANSSDTDVNVFVNGGTLQTTTMSMLPGGNLNLADGTWTFMESPSRTLGTAAGQVQLTGGRSGFTALNDDFGSTLVVNLSGGTITWGSSTFNPEILVLNDHEATALLELQDDLDLNTAAIGNQPRTIEVGSARAAQFNYTRAAIINGTISDSSGTGGLIKTSSGSNDSAPLILAGSSANTYGGPTKILGGRTGSGHLVSDLILRKPDGVTAVPGNIQIGTDEADSRGALILDGSRDGSGNPFSDPNSGDNQIADSAVIEFKNRGAADGYGYANSYGFFLLWGHEETIAGLNDVTTRGIVENWEGYAGSTPATLTVNGATNSLFNGRIRDGTTGAAVLNLVKSGTGTFSLIAGGTLADRGPSYTGTTTINGGTLKVVDAINFNSSSMTVNGPGVMDLAATESVDWAFASPLDGAGKTIKTGPGRVTMTGFSFSYSGPVEVQEGELSISSWGYFYTSSGIEVMDGAVLGGAVAYDMGPIEVHNGGTLAPGEPSYPTSPLGAGSLTLNDKTTLISCLDGFSNSYVQVYGNVTFNGASPTLVVDFDVAGSSLPASADVLTYMGTLSGTPTVLPAVDSIGTSKVTLALNPGGTQVVRATFTAITNSWDGTPSNLFNAAANWLGNTVPDVDTAGFEQALFGSGAAGGIVLLDVDNKKISSLIFDNTNSYTIDPNTPATPEKLILTTAQSGGGKVAADAQITVLQGSHTVNVPIVTEAGVDPRINIAADSQVTLNGSLSGAGDVSFYGPGTLVLGNASNTYTGKTVMQTAGTLVVAATGSLGVPGDTGPTGLVLKGMFRYTGAGTDTSARGMTLNGDMTFDIVESAADVTFTGELAVSTIPRDLTKYGAGSLSLGDASAVGTGVWNVFDVVQGGLSLNGAADSAYTVNTLHVANDLTGGSIADLTLNDVSLKVGAYDGGWTEFGYGSISEASLTMTGNAVLLNTKTGGMAFGDAGGDATVTLSGDARIDSPHGELRFAGDDGATAVISLSGDAQINGDFVRIGWKGGSETGGGHATVNLSGNSQITSTGEMIIADQGGEVGITMAGASKMISGGGMSFASSGENVTVEMTGTSEITSGDFLAFGTGSTNSYCNVTVGTPSGVDGPSLTAANWFNVGCWGGQGTFTMNANSTLEVGEASVGMGIGSVGEMTLNDSASVQAAAENTGIGVYGGAATITVNDNASLAYSGTDPLWVGGTDESTDGSATFNLNGGTLSLPGTTTDYGSQPGVTVTFNLNGGALQATTDNADFLSDANGGTLAVNVQNGGAEIDTNGHDVTITKALAEDAGSPGGGLTKLDAGDLTLTAVPTYTGATDIQEGLLQLDATSGSITLAAVTSSTGNGDLTVGAGVTLTAPSITVRTLTIGGGGGGMAAAATPVPEPDTLVLLLVGLLGLAGLRQIRNR